MTTDREYGAVFFMHVILIAASLASPFLCAWYVLILFIAAYYILLFIYGQCILTRWQFKATDPDSSFTRYYLAKLGINVSERAVKIFFHYLLPWLIFVAALIWQVALHHWVPVWIGPLGFLPS